MDQRQNNPMDSQLFERLIGQCENQQEYEELVQAHQALYVGWRDHILPLLRANGLTAKQVAEGCQVSQATASSFSRKIPAKRENVIMLAMMMSLTVDQTNDLLMRWAKFQKLYPRHPEDAIWIYLLEKGGSLHPAQRFADYYAVYQQLYQEYLEEQAKPDDAASNLDTRIANRLVRSAAAKSAAPSDAASDLHFILLFQTLFPSFQQGYQKLLDYIDLYFPDLEAEVDRKLGLEDLVTHTDGKLTLNQLFAGNPACLDRYYTKLRKLRKQHRIPNRTFLIALGIHLGMATDQLNHLLDLAGMGPLCPKDRLEGTIVFYLEELYCQFPTYFFHPQQLQISPEYDALLSYSTEDEERRQAAVAAKAEGAALGPELSPYIHLNLDSDPEETLSAYIRRRLEESNLFSANDQKKAVDQFLHLL